MNVLENLLEMKLKFKKSGGNPGVAKGQAQRMGNVDVLVMN